MSANIVGECFAENDWKKTTDPVAVLSDKPLLQQNHTLCQILFVVSKLCDRGHFDLSISRQNVVGRVFPNFVSGFSDPVMSQPDEIAQPQGENTPPDNQNDPQSADNEGQNLKEDEIKKCLETSVILRNFLVSIFRKVRQMASTTLEMGTALLADPVYGHAIQNFLLSMFDIFIYILSK